MANNIFKTKQIIKHYGETKQIVKAVEELSELQKVLCKMLNGESVMKDLIDEMADVNIMYEQIMYIYNLNGLAIEDKITEKLDRTLDRIKRRERSVKHVK